MNNKFDWNRFCQVVKKDFRNLWPTFGTTMIVLASLPFAIWLMTFVVNHDAVISPTFRVGMIMIVSSFAAIMLPSRLYRTMNLRNEGIYYAMLPASKLEKFLSMLIFTFIVAPVTVYLGSMVLDIILKLLPAGPYHQWLWESPTGFPLMTSIPFDDEILPGFHSWMLTVATWTSLFFTPALFMWAATLFKKHKVLYTFLILYAIEFVLSIVLIIVFSYLLRDPDFAEWLYDTMFKYGPETWFNWMLAGLNIFYVLGIALFIWLTWRRLKKMPY